MDRKIIGIGAMLVIGMIAIVGIAFAQGSKTVPVTGVIGANNEGVCDNAGNCPYRGHAGGFVDSDGNGVCDNAQSANCPYANQTGGFVDANNDGVCDNIANCPMHQNIGGCHGSGGCPRMKEGFKGRCHQ